ncbi:MAG: cupin domain-containing protein [Gammaproteobacteria bacterium]|nr:cupin domain-containing protein [Gammaproteobacteria bacterium]
MSDSTMHGNKSKIRTGTNFTAYKSGARSEWPDHSLEIPGLGEIHGKHFLKDIVGFTGSEISINSLPPGAGMPFYHQHQENEEIYIFIQGRGQMQIDGEIIDVQEGSVVRIAPNGLRTWRNNSHEPLLYIVAQMRANSLRQYGFGDGVVSEKKVTWPN